MKNWSRGEQEGQQTDRPDWSPSRAEWKRKRSKSRPHPRMYFWRFIIFFFMMALLFGGILAILARLLTNIFGGSEVTLLALVGTCSLFLTLPILAMGISWAMFQRLAAPVLEVMAVTDAVAEGDLSARVEAKYPGRFGQLANSLNKMVVELERSNEQRRQLTADVAHELRTPLHIIQGNLEGILDGVYAPTHEHIENTLEETQILSRLVDDLAMLSLAESGRLPLEMETVAVAELLDDVHTSFEGQAENAGIHLQVDAAPVPSIQGDILRLNQVLGNLVANALRHTPAGGAITLRAEANGDEIRLIVADTGEGIPEEDLPYVFDRFWRGDRARTHREGTGAGLGLAIAQQLVQAHGGTITVESTQGAGTTFSIDLPQTLSLSQ